MDATRFPDYPFQPRRIEVRPGIAMSYLDEGPRDGEVVVMLHGNPSWSYYWRHLVLGLRDRYRCIVPDHVGMGLSDKPGDDRYAYTLQSRVDDLDHLARPPRHHRPGDAGGARLGRHDRLRLGAVACGAGAALVDHQHRGVSVAVGEGDALAA